MHSFIRKYFEVIMILLFVSIWIYMVMAKGLPIVTPDTSSAGFLFEHYLSPLIYALIIQFILIAFWTKKTDYFWIPFLYLPLIIITVFLHFNFKT